MRCIIFTTTCGDTSLLQDLILKINASETARVVAVVSERSVTPIIKKIKKHLRKYGLFSLIYKMCLIFVNYLYEFVSKINLIEFRFQLPQRKTLSLEKFCRENGILFYEVNDFHSKSTLLKVKEISPDLGLVCGTRILKKELFDIPKKGSINIHKREVPKYRGGGPIGLWELLNKEKEIGVTIHQVVEKLDAGDIILEQKIPIDEFDNLESLKLKADLVGNELYAEAVKLIAENKITPIPQSSTAEQIVYKEPSPLQLSLYQLQLRLRNLKNIFRPILIIEQFIKILYLFSPFMFLRNLWLRAKKKSPVVIFYGHLISNRAHRMALRLDSFSKYIRYLKKYYRIVSIQEAIEILRSGKNKTPVIVFTFDDGYGDNYINIRAIKLKYNIPVSFFICSGYIGTKREFDHDLEKGIKGFYPFSWEEVKTLANEGFEIGSHTVTHTDYESLKNVDEIITSKEIIEKKLKIPVKFFSFPKGNKERVHPSIYDEVSKAGYEAAFLASGYLNYPSDKINLYQLERVPLPTSGSIIDLECAIHGWCALMNMKDRFLKTIRKIFKH